MNRAPVTRVAFESLASIAGRGSIDIVAGSWVVRGDGGVVLDGPCGGPQGVPDGVGAAHEGSPRGHLHGLGDGLQVLEVLGGRADVQIGRMVHGFLLLVVVGG